MSRSLTILSPWFRTPKRRSFLLALPSVISNLARDFLKKRQNVQFFLTEEYSKEELKKVVGIDEHERM